MHTKGRAQLRVGQMINITHDELRIERRKTTELIVSCFRDLPKVPWSDFFSRTARRGGFANYLSGATTLEGRRRRCPSATSSWRRRGRARRSCETLTRTWGFRPYAARRCRFRPRERCSTPRRRGRSRGSVAMSPVPGTRRCPAAPPSGTFSYTGRATRRSTSSTPSMRLVSLRRHESVPLDTLLGGAAGRVRVDRALASHPLLRAMRGCFKPPRCAADGVLRPTRAACPAGVEL